MALAVSRSSCCWCSALRGRAIVPSRSQSVAELAYGFVYKMVEDVAGKDGLKYFPYIMTLFMFIVFANFLGADPDVASPPRRISPSRRCWRSRCS